MTDIQHESVYPVNTDVNPFPGLITYVNTPQTFSERLALALADPKFGMSQAALAKAVGYSNQSAIGNMLSDPARTGTKRAPEIAKALNVEYNWLVSGVGPMRPAPMVATVYSIQEEQLLGLWRELPDAIQDEYLTNMQQIVSAYAILHKHGVGKTGVEADHRLPRSPDSVPPTKPIAARMRKKKRK